MQVTERIRLVHRPEVHVDVGRLLVLGTGLALFAHRRGHPVLHGTTVRLGERDVMVCGPSGVGKSSVTAALLERGAELVADDVGILDGRRVRPGLPRIKLWADTARHAGLDPRALLRVHPDFDKVSVPTPVVTSSQPLHAVVILERGPRLTRPLTGQAALLGLLANHRVPEVLDGPASARWMLAMQALAASVHVLHAGLPGPLETVADVADELVERLEMGA